MACYVTKGSIEAGKASGTHFMDSIGLRAHRVDSVCVVTCTRIA